ncbi:MULTISPECIES: hypothetical protein [Streptomyces]|uniref:hypothetical protein n=1 Tax=Streptomyces TaxID=1883 RepID=UPI0006AFCE32|nr:hypothetical protein [Streptomyces sp. NRRL F-4707]KOX32830.1 hypothetical protein ADL07_11745 [Streptomyces sp. NRRL F-4707]
MDDVYDMPLPYPTATLLLPEGAGEVQARVIQVWKPDLLATHFVVELPAWEGWVRKVGDNEARGIAPTSLTMWAPQEAVLLEDAEIARIKAAISDAITDSIAQTA